MLQQTTAITKDDYKHVELIGWLYQFYISEKKDEVFAGFKKNKKADANTIPAATQIFTPNWIVKYMVENTVGQVWLDANTDSEIASDMSYYIKPDDSYISTPIIKEAKDLKLLDPACGSGHILIEGFNLLMKCYEEEFYEPKEAVRAILKNNLFGLDIDLRAVQLARFAVLLIAAKTDPEILIAGIVPNIYEMPEPKAFSEDELCYFLGLNQNDKGYKSDTCFAELSETLELMQQAKTLGSIMKFNLSEESLNKIKERIEYWKNNVSNNLFYSKSIENLKPFLDVILIMTQKYETVVANPPYLSAKRFSKELNKYIEKYYKQFKQDLFSVFVAHILKSLTMNDGRIGIMSPFVWMFIKTYEDFRNYILKKSFISNLIQLEYSAFDGATVPICTYTLQKNEQNKKGCYIKLSEFRGSSNQAPKTLEAINNRNCHWFYATNQEEFKKIPGSPIAYWLSDKMLDVFVKNKTLAEIGDAKQGLATADNNRFLRLWNEVSIKNTCFNTQNTNDSLSTGKKWFPYNKGGARRKWFGNQDYMVDWENDGYEIKHFTDIKGKLKSRPQNLGFYFKESISWSDITSGGNSFRYYQNGFIFDTVGMSFFSSDKSDRFYILGLLNTPIYFQISKIINPTLHLNNGNLAKFPAPPELDIEVKEKIKETVQNCIDISKQDWDAHETSWNFKENELFRIKKESNLSCPNNLKSLYDEYCNQWLNTFMELRSNEEEINKTFIDYYNLNDEISYKVPLKDITLLQQGEIKLEDDNIVFQGKEIMSQFISYLIACFMGRYRLDKTGLQIAYPEPGSEEIAPYEYNGKTFEIDDDGVIPLMDSEVSFHDNALNRIKKALSIIFGDENQIDNINFIENKLGKTLEDYLSKDFYKDHCKRYSKRP
ncbi:MAG: BREX-1 system adenine-specific DNA-methyltransferase PglX, partial [Bacteroidales bacterium]